MGHSQTEPESEIVREREYCLPVLRVHPREVSDGREQERATSLRHEVCHKAGERIRVLQPELPHQRQL